MGYRNMASEGLVARQWAVQIACWTTVSVGERFHSGSKILRLEAMRYSHILCRRLHSVCECGSVVLQHSEAAPIVVSVDSHSHLVEVGLFPDQRTWCPKVPQLLTQGATGGRLVHMGNWQA